MTTEDDTFKKLSRISFDEMFQIFKNWKDPIYEWKQVEEFFNLYKWTYAEYIQGLTSRNGLY